jgi:O-antigen/teichoic acid export membrane protein
VTAYYGQVAGIAALAASGELTLPHALEVIAVSFAVGAVIQAVQNRISFREIADLRRTALEFWSIGSWSLLNNIVSLLRIQILPWTLAAAGGAAAAASFQAALNVVNLTNPVILGLCNVIPQTAARAQKSGGNGEAWRAARVYMLMGVPPIFGYYAIVLLVPGLILRIFYGAASPYVALTLDLQILALAWAVSYATDMTCSYLHGVNGARFALVINMFGALAVAVLAFPLIRTYGLAAGCAALLGANLVRLAASYHIQKRITADECIAA